MATKIQLRRKTAATWTSDNTVLSAGEPGVETDTLKVKVGDGTTAWTSLAYVGSTSAAEPRLAPGKIYGRGTVGGNLALTLGKEYFQPFSLPGATKLDQLIVDVTTAATAGGVVRLGFRQDNDGMPGDMIAQSGALAADAIGLAVFDYATKISGLSRVWLSCTPQVAAPTVRTVTGYDNLVPYLPSSGTPGQASGSPGLTTTAATYTSGAIPTTASTSVQVVSGAPAFRVRAST